MTINTLEVSVPFKDIKCLEAFLWKGEVLLKLPTFNCTVRECVSFSGRTKEVTNSYNALVLKTGGTGGLSFDYSASDYRGLDKLEPVVPLKCELNIFLAYDLKNCPLSYKR